MVAGVVGLKEMEEVEEEEKVFEMSPHAVDAVGRIIYFGALAVLGLVDSGRKNGCSVMISASNFWFLVFGNETSGALYEVKDN